MTTNVTSGTMTNETTTIPRWGIDKKGKIREKATPLVDGIDNSTQTFHWS